MTQSGGSAAAGVPALSAGFERRTLDRIDDLVVLFDALGVVRYVNPAVTRLLGLHPDEAIGRNVLDFVHPDDLPRAVDNLHYGAMAGRVEVPVHFRLRGPDGWATFDVRGQGAASDRDDGLMLLVCRETDGAELIDDLLEDLATGADMGHVVRIIARHLERRLWGNRVAVCYHGDDELAVAHTGLPTELVEVLRTATEAPWVEAAQRLDDVAVMDLTGLKPPIAEAVADAGFASVVAVPVCEESTGERAVLVSFGPADLKPNLGFGVSIERCRRLLLVALQNRVHRSLLEQSARTDPLTGIANRRRFLHQLDEVLAELAAAPQGHAVTVAFVDLDGFKPVNDRYGHVIGDQVLQVVAQRLVRIVDRQGIAARFGGDEFALLVRGRRSFEVASEVRAAIAEPITIPEIGAVRVGASVGAADADPGDASSSLLEVVDALCYRDKRVRRARR